ncbi:MAG: histidine phosphatase family protein [Chloroflexi bacterium]|nr:histidine phosphatase family protein [Chloroflexota bacterium]
MKVYFATHASSKDSEVGIASGWKDTELSCLGVQQAKQLGERFKDVPVDIVCCSDLKRAVDTVAIAFDGRLPVVIDKRLRELNYGDFNGKPADVVEKMKGDKIKDPFPKGESYEQAVARAHEFYEELKGKYPDSSVLVVGHRATRYGLDTLTGTKTLQECVNTPFLWQPSWEYEL